MEEYIVTGFGGRGTFRAWAYIEMGWRAPVACELDNKKPSGALFGIPLVIKDTIDTCDMPTEYGTDIYSGYQPGRDAACVAGRRSSNGVARENDMYRICTPSSCSKTANSWNIEHTPGGSSRGRLQL